MINYKYLEKTLRILSVFCFIKVVSECTAAYLSSLSINNMFLIHIFTPIEFVSTILIFLTIHNTKPIQTFGKIISLLFCVYCVLNALFFQPITSFNSFPQGIQCIIMIMICIYFFYRLLIADEFIDLMRSPNFWLFGGWMLYFSGTLFLFILSYRGDVNLTFSVIHSVLNILLNLIFTYAIWLGRTKSIS
jgi:hypothetical protein